MTDDKQLTLIKQDSKADSLEIKSSETDLKKGCSADNVNQYLQGLENSNSENLEALQIEEQDFSEAELFRLVNTEKLQGLLDNSDDFLGHLSGEIEGFDKDS